jgi:hypothetical protein
VITLARVYDLYIDVDAPGGADCILDANGGRRSASNPIRWIVKDVFEVRLHFRRISATIDAETTVVEQPASWAIVLAGKDPAAVGTEQNPTGLVFSATQFVRVATDDDVYYAATLSLDTSELETLLASTVVGDYETVRIDIENQDATNAARLTYQFPVRIQQQVYDNETDPVPAVPEYPSPGAIMVKIGASAALTAGQDYVLVTGLGCVTTPAIIVCTVRKPSGGATIFASVVASSITTAGFRADLSANPPATGYYLDYIVIL